MTKIYTLKYEWMEIAEVQIHHERAAPVIREMIKFREGPTEDTDDELRDKWLRKLAIFIMRNERAPEPVPEDGRGGDEGWCSMDDAHGIKLLSVTPFEFCVDDIEIDGRAA